jgi:hypothetical protein
METRKAQNARRRFRSVQLSSAKQVDKLPKRLFDLKKRVSVMKSNESRDSNSIEVVEAL